MLDMLPSPFWSVAAGIGLIGWIGGVIGLIRWGFRSDGSLSGRQTFSWAAIMVIFYMIWILSLEML